MKSIEDAIVLALAAFALGLVIFFIWLSFKISARVKKQKMRDIPHPISRLHDFRVNLRNQLANALRNGLAGPAFADFEVSRDDLRVTVKRHEHTVLMVDVVRGARTSICLYLFTHDSPEIKTYGVSKEEVKQAIEDMLSHARSKRAIDLYA